MKIFKSILILLNLILLALTIYLLAIDGNNSPKSYDPIAGGIETIFKMSIRIFSIVMLIFELIHYFEKKKNITIAHIIITTLTIFITYINN